MNGVANGVLEVFQGQFLESRFVVDDSLPNQRYVLPNNGIDTSTIRVKVKENNASTSSDEYKLVDNIIGITSTSNIYLLQETTDEKYEILFGDGIFGKKLSSGNVIDISYIKTEGKNGNGVNRLGFTGIIQDQDGIEETSTEVIFRPQFASQNGDQTISHNSNTKVAFSNEVIDTDSAYDPSTNYRFTVPSGEAGKYFFYAIMRMDSGSSFESGIWFQKNGSSIAVSYTHQTLPTKRIV